LQSKGDSVSSQIADDYQGALDKDIEPTMKEMSEWPADDGWPYIDPEYQKFVDSGAELDGKQFFNALSDPDEMSKLAEEIQETLKSPETKKDIAAMVAARRASSGARARDVVMSATDVDEKLKGIIAEQLGVDVEKVTPNASFTEDLGADSLDAVELIMAIEEAFDIEIPDEEAEKMTTPADCATAIKAKI